MTGCDISADFTNVPFPVIPKASKIRQQRNVCPNFAPWAIPDPQVRLLKVAGTKCTKISAKTNLQLNQLMPTIGVGGIRDLTTKGSNSIIAQLDTLTSNYLTPSTL
ncbi:uncharacterized protein PHALS_10235 [Plasmopara halstedii]|uniref:Uncharacterized protein n=1 Tax=Plasmopara halstedii TaxID=4781 RepID=A0A0P1AG38_PLAHL|nr:uncharacterized protein PHALS_10235 [Plasmopara halstedii]CEG40012.1 hypothetical protein PHALS_10235 [Plasmopara halstedii]|eukprot:XP_024576381.1 hypothetical protein PHALS_10235 [Plasmopara halstedii]